MKPLRLIVRHPILNINHSPKCVDRLVWACAMHTGIGGMNNRTIRFWIKNSGQVDMRNAFSVALLFLMIISQAWANRFETPPPSDNWNKVQILPLNTNITWAATFVRIKLAGFLPGCNYWPQMSLCMGRNQSTICHPQRGIDL